MERYTLDQVRDRMVHAWDGVHCLAARATMKHLAPLREAPRAPRFLEPADVGRPTRCLEAWWRAPDRWRHDVDGRDGARLSYVGIGDDWWLWQAGIVQWTGTTVDARQQGLTQSDNLSYGRPYLSPAENAQLWLWLNPAIWVASFSLALNNWSAPLRDDVYQDAHIVHVLASEGLEPNRWTGAEQELTERWWIQQWDRDEELGDFANFFQLWVDMRTGFCRRMTAEGANGRQWDILVASLILNDVSHVPDAIFAGPAATP